MADQSISDSLETVLDMMFMFAGNETRINHNLFKEFVVKELKANLSEKDLILFIKSTPQLSKDDYLHRKDLMEVFEDPFLLAKVRMLEKQSFVNQKRSEAESMMGVTTEYNPFKEAYPKAQKKVTIAKMREQDKQPLARDDKMMRQLSSISASMTKDYLDQSLNERDIQESLMITKKP